MAQGVYWNGQDGNIYMKSDSLNGVTKWMAPLMTPQQMGLTEIRDPALPPISTAAPSNPTGASAAPAPVFNSAGATNTQRTLDLLPEVLRDALLAEGGRYQNTVEDFNAQEGGQRKTYDKSTTTNQLNYDDNYMESIRAGIKGLGGLMSLLRGTGASGGTAEDQARDTVGGVTAGDIRTGADTRNENQTALDTSLEGFLASLGQKRRQNEDTRVNNERAIRRDSDTQMQELMGKMAGFYGDVGDSASANSWMARAGEITPRIAANARTQVSPYDTTPVTVQAPELSAFAAPTQPSVVTAPDGQVGSGIFTMTDPRRRKEVAPAPVPVGV